MTKHRIYVDETGLNLHLSRSRGRAQAGHRAARIVCGQRGRNMTVILAISDRVGAVYHEIVWGGVDCERLRVFLENLAIVLDEEQAVIDMDNAPAHGQAETLATHEVKKLAPYSPFLNPIENCFSVFKAALKQRLGQVLYLLDDRDAALAAGHRGISTCGTPSWRSWPNRRWRRSRRRRWPPRISAPTASSAQA